jgi:hypothetical protein
MNTPDGFSIRLNKETFDLLTKVRDDLVTSLGFAPTNGQVIRHLIAFYYGETK